LLSNYTSNRKIGKKVRSWPRILLKNRDILIFYQLDSLKYALGSYLRTEHAKKIARQRIGKSHDLFRKFHDETDYQNPDRGGEHMLNFTL
jgi:hypothetical protein